MLSEFPPVSKFDELHFAVSDLPSELREAIVMRLDDELTFAQIGDRMGRSEDAARKLFARALNQLCGRLLPESDA